MQIRLIKPTTFLGADLPFLACIKTFFPNDVVTVGTGTLVGPRLLLTAGHVVYDPLHGGKPLFFEVTLGGENRETIRATNWRSHGQWFKQDSKLDIVHRALASSDFGVVVLDKAVDARLNIASVDYQTSKAEFIDGLQLNVAGYSNIPSTVPDTAFYASSKAAVMVKVQHRVTYPVATVGGMSGGPVWSLDSSKSRTIRAIHTSIVLKAGNALRIDRAVFKKVEKWCNQFHPTQQDPQ